MIFESVSHLAASQWTEASGSSGHCSPQDTMVFGVLCYSVYYGPEGTVALRVLWPSGYCGIQGTLASQSVALVSTRPCWWPGPWWVLPMTLGGFISKQEWASFLCTWRPPLSTLTVFICFTFFPDTNHRKKRLLLRKGLTHQISGWWLVTTCWVCGCLLIDLWDARTVFCGPRHCYF